jgi:hypothetical protein
MDGMYNPIDISETIESKLIGEFITIDGERNLTDISKIIESKP